MGCQQGPSRGRIVLDTLCRWWKCIKMQYLLVGLSDIESYASTPTLALCLTQLALNEEEYIMKVFEKLGTLITLLNSFGCVPCNHVSCEHPKITGLSIYEYSSYVLWSFPQTTIRFTIFSNCKRDHHLVD